MPDMQSVTPSAVPQTTDGPAPSGSLGGSRPRRSGTGVADVIILSLADAETPPGDASSMCGSSGACGTDACASDVAGSGACATGPRVPVLTCQDALLAAGHAVELITAHSDRAIDAVLVRLDGPARTDDLTWPAATGDGPALIVAASSDAQVRAVVRRMVRRYAPPPSRRPTDVSDGRTLPDLPALAILPLDPRSSSPAGTDLADRLGLPRDPADVAKAVSGGQIRRVDLFRTDAGSITLHGALLGGVDASGQATPWHGRVDVDDIVLAEPHEAVLACAVANADGYAHLDEIELAPQANASSGVVAVAVAVPVVTRSRFGRATVRIEVRRASGRAVSVTPRVDLPILDDGVSSVLTRKRTWWVEPGAWAVFTA